MQTYQASTSSAETAACVLSYLRAKAKFDLVSATYVEMADELGFGRNTSGCAIRLLVRDGWLAVHRKGAGKGYPTIYRVTS